MLARMHKSGLFQIRGFNLTHGLKVAWNKHILPLVCGHYWTSVYVHDASRLFRTYLIPCTKFKPWIWNIPCLWIRALVYKYRHWGDKTSYLTNVKCSGEPKKHGGFNTIMNGTAFYLPSHSGSIFSDWNLQFGQDKSLYKKVIFTKYWVTRSCRPSDNMCFSEGI